MKHKDRGDHLRLLGQLFLGFFRASILGYGGGPSSIPLVYKEVVDKYRWLSNEEFSDVLALGNCLPGPISTKMAGYIGYRLAGILGLCIAVFATAVPTVILMVVFIEIINYYKDYPIVQGMVQSVSPIVGVMLLSLAYSFFKNAKIGLGWGLTIGLCIVSFVIYAILHVHPAFIIGALLVYGFFFRLPFTKRNTNQNMTK